MGRADQALDLNRSRYQVLPRTLSFVRQGDELLLLQGKPDRGSRAGRFNGVGGHVERGEELIASARREIHEETGLGVENLKLCGIIHVDAGDRNTGVMLFVFSATTQERSVRESPEGRLTWVDMAEVTKLDLLPDLPILLPRVLGMGPTDPPFSAAYRYDEDDCLVITFSE